MPTTSETSSRTASAGEDTSDALDSVYHSLRSGEANGEEAIAETVHAFAELLKAAVPVAVSQPARFLDLTFELAQQSINFQRRLMYEVLASFQRMMTEAWSDQLEANQSLNVRGARAVERPGRARRAA